MKARTLADGTPGESPLPAPGGSKVASIASLGAKGMDIPMTGEGSILSLSLSLLSLNNYCLCLVLSCLVLPCLVVFHILSTFFCLEAFLSRLPSKVVNSGSIVPVRDEIADLLGMGKAPTKVKCNK
jgi:hypothetical protein